MKKWLVLAGTAMALLLGYVIAGPWLTMRGIHAAIEQRDTSRLERYIDFLALRDSFRARIEDRLARETSALGGSIAGDLARGVFNQVAAPAVDGLVSPTGVAMLLEGRSLARRVTGADSQTGNQGEQPASYQPLSDARTRFESASRFTATTHDPDTGQNTVFVFERQGLRWRLTDIRLPNS